MRKVFIEREVFTYEELSTNAKEKVREHYKEETRASYIFSEICKDKLIEKFPNSELEVQYSLSYCQGDGLNIYGELYLPDMLRLLENALTEKEIKTLEWYFNNTKDTVDLRYNYRYNYCICNRHDYIADILDNAFYNEYSNIPIKFLKKINKLIQTHMTELCIELEAKGYQFFYEVDEDEIIQWCEDCSLEFFEDGEIFYKHLNNCFY